MHDCDKLKFKLASRGLIKTRNIPVMSVLTCFLDYHGLNKRFNFDQFRCIKYLFPFKCSSSVLNYVALNMEREKSEMFNKQIFLLNKKQNNSET